MDGSDPDRFIPVDDEPLHKQRWVNDFARLVNVQFPPQTTCKWHQHVRYGVYIAASGLNARECSKDQDWQPLQKKKGEVFCRDHPVDRRIHVVQTLNDPMQIIEVEVARDEPKIALSSDLPAHESVTGVEKLNEVPRCRVYSLVLTKDVESISLDLASDAVMVALDNASVQVSNGNVKDDRTWNSAAAEDMVLTAGAFRIQATNLQEGQARFILTEVL